MSKKVQLWGLFFVLAGIWGSSFIIMKYGLLSFSYTQIGLLRIASAFWFLGLVAFKRYRHWHRKDFWPLVGVALFGNLIPYMLFPLAISRLDSGMVGILNALVPLFTLVVGVWLFGQRTGWPSVVGVLLGLAGAVWLMWPGEGLPTGDLVYGLFPVLATVCYAFAINIINTRLQHLSPLDITLFSLTLAGLVASVGLFSTDFVSRLASGSDVWIHFWYILLLGVVGTSLAVLIFNYLIKKGGALFSASVTYAIPIVALLWGVADGEALGLRQLMGMAAILGGVYIVNVRRRKRRELTARARAKRMRKLKRSRG